MSRRFNKLRVHNLLQIPTTTSTVIVGPIDVRNWDSFSLLFQNSNTAIGFIGMAIQAAYDSSGTAADESPQWFNVPTSTLTCPSALGPTATVWTTAISPNTFGFLRVIGATSSTAVAGTFSVTVAGRMNN